MKRAAVMMALLVGLLTAADAPKGAGTEKEKESKKLQGKWIAVVLQQEGKEVPAQKVKDTKLTLWLKGSTFTFTSPRTTQVGTFRIDPSKKPKTIDLLVKSEKEKKETILGIYEWVGPRLRIAADKVKRPTEFKSSKDGPLVMTLERADD